MKMPAGVRAWQEVVYGCKVCYTANVTVGPQSTLCHLPDLPVRLFLYLEIVYHHFNGYTSVLPVQTKDSTVYLSFTRDCL